MSSLICSSIVLDAFIRMTNDFNDKFSAIRFTPISCNKLPLKQVFLINTNYTALCRSEQIIGLESFPFHKPWVIVVSEVRGICHQGDEIGRASRRERGTGGTEGVDAGRRAA